MLSLAIDSEDPVLGFSASWASALAERARYVDVIAMRAGAVSHDPSLRVHSLGKEEGLGESRRALRFYRILGRLLRERRYDVCFAHQAPLFATLGWPLLRLSGVPIVLWYAHGSVSRRLRVAERLVDRVVTSSREGFRIESPKVSVVGQGIDTDRFSPGERYGESGRVRIAVVGRVSTVKRIDLALEATALLAEEHPELGVELRVVGPDLSNGYRAELERRAERELPGRVSFVGALAGEELVAEYRAADLLLNTSETGSLDKAVLEAMSCGTLVVTSNPPFRDVLATEPDLFVEGDDPHGIMRACEAAVLAPAEEREGRSARLRQIVVEHHSQDRLIGVLVDRVFDSVSDG